MRICAILLLASLAAAGQDAREIVRRAIEADRETQTAARSYTFTEREDYRELDGAGNQKRRRISSYEVVMVEGTPYRRLIARDDHPLPAAEQQQEDARFHESIAARRAEKPEERERRLSDWQARLRKQREFVGEILEAFNFAIAREEQLDGRETYVIRAEPRPGYRPKTTTGRLLPKTKGTLWIDKEDYGCARLEAELTDTASLGLFLVRIFEGTRAVFEQTRVAGGLWLPKHIQASAAGRIALVRRFGGEWDISYKDYRKADNSVPAAGQ
jgi:hypothetical protein